MNQTVLQQSPERGTWDFAPTGWRQLFGSFPEKGISVEWHDFDAPERVPWERSFHEDSLEICLNVKGTATLESAPSKLSFHDGTVGFYTIQDGLLKATRDAGIHHSFLTIELSRPRLQEMLEEIPSPALKPQVKAFLSGSAASQSHPELQALDFSLESIISELIQPTVAPSAQSLWFQCKTLELASRFFFAPQAEEFFCTRQKRTAQERVQKTQLLLRENLEKPLSLKTIGKLIGCSPFYLSRTFSQEVGMSIPQFVRQLRIEKAAELLRSGDYNVTEASMEVGYSSVSHFTKAFHQVMGCCPGLYPIAKSAHFVGGRKKS